MVTTTATRTLTRPLLPKALPLIRGRLPTGRTFADIANS